MIITQVIDFTNIYKCSFKSVFTCINKVLTIYIAKFTNIFYMIRVRVQPLIMPVTWISSSGSWTSPWVR